MTLNSFAAQAVACGPQTIAQPSFEGHGWLVVINLAFMTSAFVLASMLLINLAGDIWRNRARDGRRDPVTIARLIGCCFATGITLRCGVEAATLWGWNPADPVGTGWFMTLKRFVDPIAVMCGVAGMVLLKLSERGMAVQLSKRPFPIDMWASLPMILRPAGIAVLSLIAAIGVVSTR